MGRKTRAYGDDWHDAKLKISKKLFGSNWTAEKNAVYESFLLTKTWDSEVEIKMAGNVWNSRRKQYGNNINSRSGVTM